jgi:plastocyanin
LGANFHGGVPRRALLLAAACGVAVLSAAGIASAGGTASGVAPDRATLTAEFEQGRLFFRPRNLTIASGGTLTIENGQPGIPHTVSLARESLLPKTRRQRRMCFNPGHICFALIARHRALDNNNANDVDRVNAGRPGLDKLNGISQRGDSIFFNRRSRSVVVSAPSGSTLPYLCLIHPNMQGRINVE